MSLAMQNEILINKIQEQFGEFKNNHTSEITRLETLISGVNITMETRFQEFAENIAKNSMTGIQEQLNEIKQMEES